MKSILLLGVAREGSTRCKNKMTKELYNKGSLFSIYLKKFRLLKFLESTSSNFPFSDVAMAVCPHDKTLWKMAMDSKVHIIPRDKNSITGFRKLSELLSCLEDFKDKYKYVMVVNGCMPFLKPKTIIEAGKFFQDNKKAKSLIAVVKRKNWYWNDKSRIINQKDPNEMATQLTPPVYETIHTFHTAPIKRLLNYDKFWLMKPKDPALFQINSPIECLDVDTEEDFKICSALMKGGLI